MMPAVKHYQTDKQKSRKRERMIQRFEVEHGTLEYLTKLNVLWR